MDKRITEQHYEDALHKIADSFSSAEVAVKPVSMYQNGNIGTIGVSDIDLIFVFPDSFNNGNRFAEVYNEAISGIPFKEVLFIHNPMLLCETSMRYLPTYTMNPAKELRTIFGKQIHFETERPGRIQSILISLEFIQFRLFQLINMLRGNNLNQHGVLLRGHSMKHSITLAENAGMDVSDMEFAAFNLVENIRHKMNEGNDIRLSKKEVTNLSIGIIHEFNLLYKRFAEEAEGYIRFYLPQKESYSYNENIEMADLFNKNNKLTLEYHKPVHKVLGMHWINMLIKDLYFGTADSTTIIAEEEFEQECLQRANFHKEQWKWNKNVFGNIHAGLSPMPAVIGEKAEQYARENWAI